MTDLPPPPPSLPFDRPGHPSFEELSAFVDGKHSVISLHVAACSNCQADVELLRETLALSGQHRVPRPSLVDEHVATALALFDAIGRGESADDPVPVGATAETNKDMADHPFGAPFDRHDSPIEFARGRSSDRRRRNAPPPWILTVAAMVALAIGSVPVISQLNKDRSLREVSTTAANESGGDAADTAVAKGSDAPVDEPSIATDPTSVSETPGAPTVFAGEPQTGAGATGLPPSSGTDIASPTPVASAPASKASPAASGAEAPLTSVFRSAGSDNASTPSTRPAAIPDAAGPTAAKKSARVSAASSASSSSTSTPPLATTPATTAATAPSAAAPTPQTTASTILASASSSAPATSASPTSVATLAPATIAPAPPVSSQPAVASTTIATSATPGVPLAAPATVATPTPVVTTTAASAEATGPRTTSHTTPSSTPPTAGALAPATSGPPKANTAVTAAAVPVDAAPVAQASDAGSPFAPELSVATTTRATFTVRALATPVRNGSVVTGVCGPAGGLPTLFDVPAPRLHGEYLPRDFADVSGQTVNWDDDASGSTAGLEFAPGVVATELDSPTAAGRAVVRRDGQPKANLTYSGQVIFVLVDPGRPTVALYRGVDDILPDGTYAIDLRDLPVTPAAYVLRIETCEDLRAHVSGGMTTYAVNYYAGVASPWFYTNFVPPSTAPTGARTYVAPAANALSLGTDIYTCSWPSFTVSANTAFPPDPVAATVRGNGPHEAPAGGGVTDQMSCSVPPVTLPSGSAPFRLDPTGALPAIRATDTTLQLPASAFSAGPVKATTTTKKAVKSTKKVATTKRAASTSGH